MSTPQKLLVAYGVIALSYGLLLGLPLAAARAKAAVAPRHLVTTHLSGLIQGAVHLGLAFVVGLVAFDSGLATVAAGLVVAGSLLELAGGTANWLGGTGDQFAERSAGYRLNALSGLMVPPGVLVIAWVTLSRL